MKKYITLSVCFILLLASILCACAESGASSSISTGPSDILFSAPTESKPTQPSKPTSTDSSIPVPTEPSVPTPTEPSVPVPTEPAFPMPGDSTDWQVADTQIIPFEERFQQDLIFGNAHQWLVSHADTTILYDLKVDHANTRRYYVSGSDGSTYFIPYTQELRNYNASIVNGQSIYWSGNREILKMDILTGEWTTFYEADDSVIAMYVQPCGKETFCILTVTEPQTLRIFYKDVHTAAERTVYEATMPETDFSTISVGMPESSLGTIRWSMQNPAFYQALQKILADPNSPYRQHPQYDYSRYWEEPEKYPISRNMPLCYQIQEDLGIPYRLTCYYDPATGTLTEDLGVIDKCWFGSGYAHDHDDYENTFEEIPQIILSDPLPIAGMATFTAEQIEQIRNNQYDFGKGYTFLYSEYGYGLPYLSADGIVTPLSDVPCKEVANTQYFVYCMTIDGRILQISPDGTLCNTIYTAKDTLDDLCYCAGMLYFQDGDKIMEIDTIEHTSRVLLQASNLFVSTWEIGTIEVSVTHGLYYQQFLFTPETGKLEKTHFL